MLDAIWNETVNEVLMTGVQRRPRHDPSASCDLCPGASQSAHIQDDVATSGNDPRIADRRHGPAG